MRRLICPTVAACSCLARLTLPLPICRGPCCSLGLRVVSGWCRLNRQRLGRWRNSQQPRDLKRQLLDLGLKCCELGVCDGVTVVTLNLWRVTPSVTLDVTASPSSASPSPNLGHGWPARAWRMDMVRHALQLGEDQSARRSCNRMTSWCRPSGGLRQHYAIVRNHIGTAKLPYRFSSPSQIEGQRVSQIAVQSDPLV